MHGFDPFLVIIVSFCLSVVFYAGPTLLLNLRSISEKAAINDLLTKVSLNKNTDRHFFVSKQTITHLNYVFIHTS